MSEQTQGAFAPAAASFPDGAAPSLAIDLFTAQVAVQPEATALVAACGRLTYGELDAQAGRIASWLRGRGVATGDLVGICLERSFDQLATVLGAWRAGAAFLPFDPTWPDGRLRAIAAEAHCALIVGREDIGERLPDGPTAVLDWRAPALADASPVEHIAIDPASVAYVIYTSGTTGTPKGVEVTHANLSWLIAWHNHAFAVTGADRGSHLAGLGFDASVWEVWPYLAAGASIALAPDEARTSRERLQAWLLVQGVTVAFAPTALAQELIRADWPAGTRLRTLLTGADRLLGRPRAGLPFALVNNYGPTECTVVATSAAVPPEGQESGLPAIGHPITGTTVYLLDPDGRQAADGEQGEIVVGGPQVARGYRGRPELTAAAFVRGPGGERMYRTGDLGVRRGDGQITFHGRLDDQAKVRGHRVEPAETAAVLRSHAAVSDAAVIAAPALDGGDMLVAYIVGDDELSAEALRAFTGEQLPEYMVPGAFVRVAALPLTANGKLDRAALPPPSEANALAVAAHAEAGSPIEQRLSEILAKVLGRGGVGIDDNFFLLGGHSLLGTQVVLRAGEAFSIELTLRDLFQAPTIRQLSARIEEVMLATIEAMSDDEVAARAAE